LEVSKAGSVEEIAELQSPVVARPDVCFHIGSSDLGKNKTGSCPADDIEREFAEEGIYRGPFHSVEEGNIPIGTHSEFHRL
jgi:hypothetical protein